jgi:hypothetical protein
VSVQAQLCRPTPLVQASSLQARLSIGPSDVRLSPSTHVRGPVDVCQCTLLVGGGLGLQLCVGARGQGDSGHTVLSLSLALRGSLQLTLGAGPLCGLLAVLGAGVPLLKLRENMSQPTPSHLYSGGRPQAPVPLVRLKGVWVPSVNVHWAQGACVTLCDPHSQGPRLRLRVGALSLQPCLEGKGGQHQGSIDTLDISLRPPNYAKPTQEQDGRVLGRWECVDEEGQGEEGGGQWVQLLNLAPIALALTSQPTQRQGQGQGGDTEACEALCPVGVEQWVGWGASVCSEGGVRAWLEVGLGLPSVALGPDVTLDHVYWAAWTIGAASTASQPAPYHSKVRGTQREPISGG